MVSLRTKILTVVLAFLAIISATFLFYSVFTTANYKSLRLENIAKTVEFETEKVNKTIAKIEIGSIFFAQGGYLCYEAQSAELGESLVLDYLRGFPTVIGGGFWYEPYSYNADTQRMGFYAFFDNILGKARLDDTFLLNEYDYHNSGWYRDVIDNIREPNQVVWTKPYVDDTGSYSLMTTAGCGVYDRTGNLIGISTIDWGIQDVIEELSAVKPTQNSFVLLCVPDNDYVISNTYTNGDTGMSIKSLPWDIAADSFELDGVTYMSFSRVMDNGWHLSVQIPANEIFAEVENRNNRFTILIGLSSALMLWLAFYLISKLINAPLTKLITDVAQLNLGNLDTQVEVSTKDELGILAQTFNKMTRDLKESIESNARERAEKERIGAELSIATKIQASMLPCIFPAFPERSDFDIYASMLPAKEVGGDFYDFFLLDDDRLAIVIADVSGKGIPAALFMVITKILIKNNVQYGKTPKQVFETVNGLLCENNEANMFVTAFMGILDIPTGRFTYVNAGHNPPLIKRRDGLFEVLPTKAGFVLAGIEDMVYEQDEIALSNGDMLYLYTDGVTEAANQENQLFSERRLMAILNKYRDCQLQELLGNIKAEIDLFANGAEQADDITMLVMRIIKQ